MVGVDPCAAARNASEEKPMKIQSLLLASVVAAGGFALPAFAADSHHGKHKRFSETRITAQLNRQQLRHPGMAGVHRWARLNDQRIAKADKSEKSEAPDTGRDFATANPNPTAATKMLARTGNEMDQAVGLKTPVSDKEMHKAVPLDRVMNPLHSLDTAEIKNQMGEPIGDVRSVVITDDGTARAVRADVGGFLGMNEKTVTIPADKLMYLKNRNLLVTDMSKTDISKLSSNEI
jgi:hypothetical protein